MNIIGRGIAALVGLALLAAALVLALMPAAVFGWLGWVQSSGGSLIAAVAIAMGAVGLLLLIANLWPFDNTRLARGRVGESVVHYRTDAIETELASELANVEGVRRAKVRVHGGRHDGVESVVRMVVDATYDPQDVVSRANARVVDKLERSMGLRVNNCRMVVDKAEMPRVDRRAERPV